MDWSDLYAEHYSVWSEVNSFANARQEYETISSCLSTILADIKLLPDTRNISNVQVLVQLFNSLSSIFETAISRQCLLRKLVAPNSGDTAKRMQYLDR